MADVAQPRVAPGSRLLARARRLSERADALAVRHSTRPHATLGLLLALSLGLALIGVPAGLLINDDPPAYFREGMPGTWLSAAMLLAAAVAARAVHRREADGPAWHASFWGLSAAILVALTVVELGQPTVFLGRWLEESLAVSAPYGIVNVDAALLIVLLATIVIVLARRALVLREHPGVAALLAAGVMFGVASQALDSFWAVSTWEFVAEESLKAVAGPFVVAGYLAALRARHPSPPARGVDSPKR
jgi:hypothetical protein